MLSGDVLGVTKQRWVAIMEMLESEGYITGLSINHDPLFQRWDLIFDRFFQQAHVLSGYAAILTLYAGRDALQRRRRDMACDGSWNPWRT